MKKFIISILILLSLFSLKAQVTKDVRYYQFSGRIQDPLTFLFTNIYAGSGISIAWNSTNGSITISSTGSGGTGTNALVQTNGINIGSIGTINFIGATGMVAGGIVTIGGFSGGSSVGTSNISVMTNSTIVVSILTNLNFITGTNISILSTNASGSVSLQILAIPSSTNTTFQFNDNGFFAGTEKMLYNKANGSVGLNIGGRAPRGDIEIGGTVSQITLGSSVTSRTNITSANNIQQFNSSYLIIPHAEDGTYFYTLDKEQLYAGISNATDLGKITLPFRSNYFNNLTLGQRIILRPDDFNTEKGLGLQMTNAVLNTNILWYSITNPVIGQGLIFNTVTISAGQAHITLTNVTIITPVQLTVISNMVNTTSNFTYNIATNVATNMVKYLTNLWGDVAHGFAGLLNRAQLRYDTNTGFWSNYPGSMEVFSDTLLRGSDRWIDGGYNIAYSNRFASLAGGSTNIYPTNIQDGQTLYYKFYASNGTTVSFPSFAASDYVPDGLIVVPYTNCWTEVIIKRTGVITNITILTAPFTLTNGANITLTTNYEGRFITIAASGGSGSPGGVVGNLQVHGTGGVFVGSTNAWFNVTNGFLGIGMNNPSNAFVLSGLNGQAATYTIEQVVPATTSTQKLSIGSLLMSPDVTFSFGVNKLQNWRIGNSADNYAFYPVVSNSYDNGTWISSVRTNWINDILSKDNISILQQIGKANDAFTFLGSNTAPIISINSNGFLVMTNLLTNYTRGNTIAAPTNTLVMGLENNARMRPSWFDENGMDFGAQVAFSDNRIFILNTSSGSTIGTYGISSVTGGGLTVSHPTPDHLQPYMVDLATTAASNAAAFAFMSVNLAQAGTQTGNTRGNGYFFASEWSDTNNISGIVGGGGNRHFIGLTASAAPNLTNIVNVTNATDTRVGLMLDTKQTLNMYISANDGIAANEFRTNTGINFVATNLYQFYLYQAPTSRFIRWKVKDLTARLEAAGWFTNNVPTNMMKAGILTKNGTNRAHSIRFSRLYLEAPLTPR